MAFALVGALGCGRAQSLLGIEPRSFQRLRLPYESSNAPHGHPPNRNERRCTRRKPPRTVSSASEPVATSELASVPVRASGRSTTALTRVAPPPPAASPPAVGRLLRRPALRWAAACSVLARVASAASCEALPALGPMHKACPTKMSSKSLWRTERLDRRVSPGGGVPMRGLALLSLLMAGADA